jgi:hypothetical protein
MSLAVSPRWMVTLMVKIWFFPVTAWATPRFGDLEIGGARRLRTRRTEQDQRRRRHAHPTSNASATTVPLATSVPAMLFLSVGESGDNNRPSPVPRSRSNLLPPQARPRPLKKKVAALGEDRASCKASCVLGSRLSTHVGRSVEKAQPRRGEHVQRL